MSFSAKKRADDFLSLRSFFEEVHNACEINDECMTRKEFEMLLLKRNIKTRLKYSRGQYVTPKGPEKNKTGNQYFRIMYGITSDTGYEASGGKNVELVVFMD